MLPARRVAKESQSKGAEVDSKLGETAEAQGAPVEDDKVAGMLPAVGLANGVLYPPEPVFVPREDGPAAAWLACAQLQSPR
jgi:hypothetical protein